MKVEGIRLDLRLGGRLKAWADITFDHGQTVRGCKVVDGQRGLFVCLPRRAELGRQDANPLFHGALPAEIEERVLAEYRRLASGQASPPQTAEAAQAGV